MSGQNAIIIYKVNDKVNVEVKMIDGGIWLSLDQIVELYQSSKSNISEHLKHILSDGELDSKSVVRNFRITASDGKNYNVKHYSLDAVIAVGYRVRGDIGIRFRQWATETLHEYLSKGFVMNDNLLKEAGGGRYFKELLARIRDIRSSEKVFWRQVLDIFATSVDYNPQSPMARSLLKTIQNKMHWAVAGRTAAEIINERADAAKDFMGLTSFSGDYPVESDAFIAKNYLSRNEVDTLNRLVSLYLDFAELQAKEEKVMTMADWVNELDYFLKMTRKDILSGKGNVSHEEAIEHAKEEYGKFKNRFLDHPTENERVYMAGMHQLFTIEKKGK